MIFEAAFLKVLYILEFSTGDVLNYRQVMLFWTILFFYSSRLIFVYSASVFISCFNIVDSHYFESFYEIIRF